MASMTKIVCACGCGRTRMVRTADVARGWGKYYSKSCKARDQERRTGLYKELQAREHTMDRDRLLYHLERREALIRADRW